MKFLTNILAFYLFSLSLWPCADDALPLTEQAGETVSIATAGPETSPNAHNHDQCTPFCTCSCCATTITVAPCFYYDLLPSSEIVVEAVAAFAYVRLYWASPLLTIWQPPKLRV